MFQSIQVDEIFDLSKALANRRSSCILAGAVAQGRLAVNF